MKFRSIASTVFILLAQESLFFGVNADDNDSKLRSPQCVHGLNKYQLNTLQHFNGIFGDFRVTSDKSESSYEGSIYGPIAAINITTSNYGINTLSQKLDCMNDNYFLRYGLISKNANVNGNIYGDAWTENGSITRENTLDGRCSELPFRILEPKKDYLETIWSFAPTAIKNTSKKLAELNSDSVISAINTGLVSVRNQASFEGFRILKLPACSDKGCAAIARGETNPNVLKGGSSWTGNYKGVFPSDEMIVFNVPVYVGSTFTISTLDVTKNISPCQAVYNFYAVDQSGKPVNDPQAYFTLVRSPNVVIKGTILAPQARIIDTNTGYFGGQLITLQSYDGKGAIIKDFSSVSNGECTARSLCWPQGPKVVVEVVTVSDVTTHVSTVHTTSTRKGTQSVQTRTLIHDDAYPAPSPRNEYHLEEQNIADLNEVGMQTMNKPLNYIAEPTVSNAVNSGVDRVWLQVVTETAKATVTNLQYNAAVHTSTIVDIIVQVRSRASHSI